MAVPSITATEQQISVEPYILGFIGSLVTTITAYVLVTHHTFSKTTVLVTIGALAFTQAIMQLIFFLHLGRERSARWRLLTFVAMLGVVLILVLGSLWIMHNLNYRMSPEQMNTYMLDQDNL